jgi:hypothetical protein
LDDLRFPPHRLVHTTHASPRGHRTWGRNLTNLFPDLISDSFVHDLAACTTFEEARDLIIEKPGRGLLSPIQQQIQAALDNQDDSVVLGVGQCDRKIAPPEYPT